MAFLEQNKAEKCISKIKAEERLLPCDSDCEASRVRPSAGRLERVPHSSGTIATTNNVQPAVASAGSGSGTTPVESDASTKKRANPYAKANSFAKKPSNKPDVTSLASASAARETSQGKPPDSLKTILHKSESDMYTGKDCTSFVDRVKTNIPEEFRCPLCDLSPDKVSILHALGSNSSLLIAVITCRHIWRLVVT